MVRFTRFRISVGLSMLLALVSMSGSAVADAGDHGSAASDGTAIWVPEAQFDRLGYGAYLDPDESGAWMERETWRQMVDDAPYLRGFVRLPSDHGGGDGEPVIVPMAGNDYDWVHVGTDYYYNRVIKQLGCKNYTSIPQTCFLTLSGTISTTVSATYGMTYSAIQAEVGFSVGWSLSVTESASATAQPYKCTMVKFMEQKKRAGWEVWERDVFFDDYIGPAATSRNITEFFAFYEYPNSSC